MWWEKYLHKDIGTCKLQTFSVTFISPFPSFLFKTSFVTICSQIESKWHIQSVHVYSVFIHPLKLSNDIWNIYNWSQFITYGLKWQNYMPREVKISFHYFSQVKSVWPRRDKIIISTETWAVGRKMTDQADSVKRKSHGRADWMAGNKTALRRESS